MLKTGPSAALRICCVVLLHKLLALVTPQLSGEKNVDKRREEFHVSPMVDARTPKTKIGKEKEGGNRGGWATIAQ